LQTSLTDLYTNNRTGWKY